jgi:hypothetical protein
LLTPASRRQRGEESPGVILRLAQDRGVEAGAEAGQAFSLTRRLRLASRATPESDRSARNTALGKKTPRAGAVPARGKVTRSDYVHLP